MTIRYNQEVATVRCGGFLRLLLKWKGSVYKLLWFELSIFLGLYSTLSLCYHFAMSEASKRTFENVAQYCNKYSNMIPLSFVLGFYVQRVISRFWEQFNCIPWPSRMALYVSTYIQCNDERGRLMRRTIMRYICLAFIMTMSSISPQIKKRFPTLNHLTEAGFLMVNEQRILENMKTANNKYFVPFIWATSVVAKARKEGKIKSDVAVQKLVTEINDFRGGCGGLFSFDWVSIPLGYTQVVSLAVYIFSLCCLLGRYQFEKGSPAEKHFPFFTILQFVFYMGWLKVAESGLSPFGEDDDDFDINLLVDRHLHESYMVVDEMFMKSPDMLKDQHWDQVDFDLPYTSASAAHRKNDFLGSATGVEVPVDKQGFVAHETSHADLKSTSSIAVHSPRKRSTKKKLKRAPTLVEDTSSKESVLISGEMLNSAALETAPRPGSLLGERHLDTAAGEHPAAELKPSTSSEKLSSISTGQQSSSSAELQPSTSAEKQPSTSAGQKLSIPAGQKLSTSAGQHSSTSAGQQLSTTDGQQPSTTDEQQPSTSDGQQPRSSTEQELSAAEEQRRRTEQEVHLMALFQDQLKELRSS